MKRSPFQGVATVVRFNWHFYAFALAGVAALGIAATVAPAWLARASVVAAALVTFTVVISLLATWLAYDASGLYRFDWLAPWLPAHGRAANIHAGFDESTALLRAHFPGLSWSVFDFYDPEKHTEISIRRARLACPPSADTVRIPTRGLPLANASFDRILLLLAAHEIRDAQERSDFFKELHRILAPGGLVIVAEHLRDRPNIAAYNLGAWHFHRPAAWKTAFASAGFEPAATLKPAPFITAFILKKNGKSD